MGWPLGPILGYIFLVELDRSVIPTLTDKMKCWTRYVDDTLCYIKTDSIDYVLKMLNGFHRNIQFTYEVETDLEISFLDVLLIRNSSNIINTTVYRKTSTMISIWIGSLLNQARGNGGRQKHSLKKLMMFVLTKNFCKKS